MCAKIDWNPFVAVSRRNRAYGSNTLKKVIDLTEIKTIDEDDKRILHV